jgi:glycosyltransferase involved in cell wall biosynthesis
MGLYNFRKELLEELLNKDNEVYISLPNDEYVPKLQALGCNFVETHLDRRGTNPIKDIKLILQYTAIIRRIKPDVVLTYTIKPNVYGGIACRITKTPYLTNVTGLGTSMEGKGLVQKVSQILYKIGLKRSSCVFFQNRTNEKYFIDSNIIKGNTKLLPGSGVNLDQHCLEEYPPEDENIKFLFIGRIMRAKGIEELLSTAKKVKVNYPDTEFHLVGGMEEDYSKDLNDLVQSQIIEYHGQRSEIHSFIKSAHATILPSYHEGTANVLLESASTGRPVLASHIPGCKETFDDGKTGIGFQVKSAESLEKAIIKFINLSYIEKKEMGMAARTKMEKEYDRKMVIDAYIDELNKINR